MVGSSRPKLYPGDHCRACVEQAPSGLLSGRTATKHANDLLKHADDHLQHVDDLP